MKRPLILEGETAEAIEALIATKVEASKKPAPKKNRVAYRTTAALAPSHAVIRQLCAARGLTGRAAYGLSQLPHGARSAVKDGNHNPFARLAGCGERVLLTGPAIRVGRVRHFGEAPRREVAGRSDVAVRRAIVGKRARRRCGDREGGALDRPVSVCRCGEM